MSARDEILARIRDALDGDSGRDARDGEAAAPRGYRLISDRTGAELVGLLAERLRDYGAAVRECEPASLPAAVAAALAARGAHRLVVPPGLDLPGLNLPSLNLPGLNLRSAGEGIGGGGVIDGAEDIEVVVDDGLTAHELDAFDAVITTAALAIAETGTIVLDGSPGQGRRALSLIPDYHLCVLFDSQVVGMVTEAIRRLAPPRPLTWISGPSATSDIELDRVQGVHGPRTLEVILVNSPAD